MWWCQPHSQFAIFGGKISRFWSWFHSSKCHVILVVMIAFEGRGNTRIPNANWTDCKATQRLKEVGDCTPKKLRENRAKRTSFWLLKMVCNTLPKLNTSQLKTLKTCLREREGSSTNHDFSGARLESNYTMTNDWNQDAFPNLEFKHAPSTRNTSQSLMNIWSRQTLIEGLHLKGAVLFSPEWCLLVGPVKKNLEHWDPFANKNPGVPMEVSCRNRDSFLGGKMIYRLI